MQIGTALEAILMSTGLAYRMNEIREDKEKATQRALEAETKLSEKLEATVAERTDELEKRNTDLIEANKTKDRFFSILAHDLRRPIGNLAVLFDEFRKGNREMTKSNLHHFADITGNIYSLLEDLLTWAKSQKGSLELNPVHCNIAEPVEQSIALHSVSAEKKEISLTYLKPDEDIFVFADQSTVTTVIRNLLSNAIKFTPRVGNVKIETIRADNKVNITVKDNGMGIDPERMKKLFKLGEKNVSSPGTDNEKGTGLGLVLCNEFAIANKGKMSVQSSPGEGSSFTLTVPAGKKQTSAEKLGQTLAGLRFLVVEDNLLNFQTTSLVLNRTGTDYDRAVDGIEAVEMAKKITTI